MSLIGTLFGGAAKPFTDTAETYMEQKGETRRTEVRADSDVRAKQLSTTAALQAGQSTWRPMWMHTIRKLLSWYFKLSFAGATVTFAMLVSTFLEYAQYSQWAQIKDDLVWFLASWVALGASLASIATWSFLGYSPFRSIYDKNGGGNVSQKLFEVARNVIPERLQPKIIRESMPEPIYADEGIERVSGIVVPGSDSSVQPFAEPRRVARSKYLTQAELECKGRACDCEYPGLDPLVLAIADELREVFGPIVSNSAFRCPAHNKAVGGAKKSYHLYGQAIDLRALNASPQQIYDYLNNKYPKQFGIGLYNTFVHIDTRTNGWARKTGPQRQWRAFKQPQG